MENLSKFLLNKISDIQFCYNLLQKYCIIFLLIKILISFNISKSFINTGYNFDDITITLK